MTKASANELALGGDSNKRPKFLDKEGTVCCDTGGKKAIVSMRCLFDSIECVDASGNLYSFPLERLELHQNNPIPLKIHRQPWRHQIDAV